MSPEVSSEPGETYDVFLSYTKADAGRAKLLAGALEDAGIRVWWDHDIPPGMTWAQVIERAINASKTVVVVWTKNSVASEWVQKEARKGEQMRALIPVLAEPTDIPFEFEHVQGANLTDWDGHSLSEGFESVLQSIERLTNAQVDRERVVQAWRRKGRKRGALVTALSLVWLAVAAALLYVPVGTTSLDLVGMKVAGLLITLDTLAVTEMGSVPVDFLAVSADRDLDRVVVTPADQDRITTFQAVPNVTFEPKPGDRAATLRLTGFTYPPGSVLEIQRPFDDYSLQAPPTDDWVLTASGRWQITAGGEEVLFDFEESGTVIIDTDQTVFFDFEPAAAEEVVLFEAAAISDVEFSYVPLGDQAALSTVHGGTLAAGWASGLDPLHESSRLGFDAYRGRLGRLWIAGDTLRANLVGGRVSGVRLDDEEIMPSFLATRSLIVQGSIIFGLVLSLAAIGALWWNWRARW